jgi:hypothetical protein
MSGNKKARGTVRRSPRWLNAPACPLVPNRFPYRRWRTTLPSPEYIGVTALLFLFLQPLIVALRSGWRNRDDLRGDLLIGFAAALLIFYVHCYFEWTFFTDQVQYLFAMTLALIAGTAQQLGYWRRPKAQREPPPPRRFVGRRLGGTAGRVKITEV